MANQLWESIDINDIPESNYHGGSRWRIAVMDFYKSDVQSAEVKMPETGNQIQPESLRPCVLNAVVALGLKDEIQVAARGDRVFMIRKENGKNVV